MAKVILATDFSLTAQNALSYAAELASYLLADLELIHAYAIPFAYTDSPIPLLNVEEIQNIAEESMHAECMRIKSIFPNLDISQKIIPGELIECLMETIKMETPILVVLGTSGSGSESFLWGSMAVKGLRTLSVPVLAVASDVSWRPVRHLGVAADYAQISEDSPFEKVIEWTKKMNAHLSIVHYEQEETDMETPEIVKDKFKELDPKFYSIRDEDMVKGINDFLQKNAIDWLVVIPRKYGFLENLFHKSRTKILAQGSNVPVLALHPYE